MLALPSTVLRHLSNSSIARPPPTTKVGDSLLDFLLMAQGHVPRVRLLYKTILRLHRGLPPELQALGTAYTRDEFKRHRTCNEAEAAVFMSEWTNYAIDLSEQLGLRGPKTARDLGKRLDAKALNHLRDEQIAQLYELHLAATAPKKED